MNASPPVNSSLSKKRWKIRNKFLIVFFSVGIVPLVVMGTVAVLSVSRTHRIDISSLELQLIGQKQVEIEKFLEGIELDLNVLRAGENEQENIGSVITQLDYRDQEFFLEGFLQAYKYLQEISLVNINGEETTKRFRGVKETEKNRIELLNISQLEKFHKASSEEKYRSPLYHTLQGAMVTIAEPVKNKDGVVIMIAAGELTVSEQLQEIAKTARLGNEGYFYILDQQGRLLAHSISDYYKPSQFLGNHSLAKSVLKGEKRLGLENRDRYQSAWGKDVIGAGVPLEGMGWALIAEWPVKDAFEVIRIMNLQLYILASFVFFVILLLTVWVTRRIAKPIQVLEEGAKVIGEGEFGYRINIKTHDELEDLGDTFNSMAADLAKVEELRAKAIRSEALQKSLEIEQELSRNKDSFIGNTSHQLRTPIATISWSLESAIPEAEQFKPELGVTLKAAYEGTQSLNEILNDLLAVSEYGFGFHEEKREPVDFDALLQEVSLVFRPRFQAKNISFNYQKSSVSKVLANPVVLKKALGYLFDNVAIYANTKVEASLKEEGNEVIFELRDDGIGIPEEDKSLIFTQFFRAKNAIQKKNVGTGLGLFITKNIISGLNGRIWFESKENTGSTFFIALPKTNS